MPLTETLTFGPLLKQMRKRAGMTQRDLAAALDYSDSLISSLEKSQGLPNLEAVITRNGGGGAWRTAARFRHAPAHPACSG
jgi:DNA-binding XRE family transcriptional regulator